MFNPRIICYAEKLSFYFSVLDRDDELFSVLDRDDELFSVLDRDDELFSVLDRDDEQNDIQEDSHFSCTSRKAEVKKLIRIRRILPVSELTITAASSRPQRLCGANHTGSTSVSCAAN